MAARLNRRSPKPPQQEPRAGEQPGEREPLDQVWQEQAKEARRRRTARKLAENAANVAIDILSAWQ